MQKNKKTRRGTTCIKTLYSSRPGDFYDIQMNGNGLRAMWFKKRQATIRMFVNKYRKNGLVLDMGCGNCLWNNAGIPVAGIDVCENMLRYNMRKKCFYPVRADVSKPLPVKSNSVDTIVVTEVLEHFVDYSSLVMEMEMVLKKNGVIIGSVPYSKSPGLWGLIFPVWCLYKGIFHGDKYYLNKCGHQVNFNIKKIKHLLSRFELLEIKTLGLLTIFFAARKK